MKVTKGTTSGGKKSEEIRKVESLIAAYEQDAHVTPGVMKFTGLAAGTGSERAYKMVTDDVAIPSGCASRTANSWMWSLRFSPGEPGGLTVEKLK